MQDGNAGRRSNFERICTIPVLRLVSISAVPFFAPDGWVEGA